MSLVLGTNCGFVTSAPTADPNATQGGDVGNHCLAIRDSTLPSGDWIITEIGWWQSRDDNSDAAYNCAIYTDTGSPTKPYTLIATQNSGNSTGASSPGWKKYTGLSISITGGVAYWIAAGVQTAANQCRVEYTYQTGRGYRAGDELLVSGPTIVDPWNSSGEWVADDYLFGIYAVYEEASSGLSIPIAMASYRRRRM